MRELIWGICIGLALGLPLGPALIFVARVVIGSRRKAVARREQIRSPSVDRYFKQGP